MNIPEEDASIEFAINQIIDDNDEIIGWTGANRSLRILKHKFNYESKTTNKREQKLIAVKVQIIFQVE